MNSEYVFPILQCYQNVKYMIILNYLFIKNPEKNVSQFPPNIKHRVQKYLFCTKPAC